MDKAIYIVIVGKAFINLYFVFDNTTKQIIRNTCIKCGMVFICKNIDIKVIIHLFYSKGRSPPTRGRQIESHHYRNTHFCVHNS